MSKENPDYNDHSAKVGPVVMAQETERLAEAAVLVASSKYKTAWDLLEKHQMQKRPSVINGIARERDIVNIVAGSKMGKTWFCHGLALAVASGNYFLRPEWQCEQGNVVIFDNELHEDTIAHRLPFIAEAMGLPNEVLKNIVCVNLRGKLSSGDKNDEGIDIVNLAPLITEIKAFKPKFVLFDAFYRFLPEGVAEMDAGAITRVYNRLDRYAEIIGTAAFGCVIHTTKGGQGEKSVTEVGSGTGAFTRATDNHFVIREHETEGQYVVESAARDQEQQPPVVIRKAFPLYEIMAGEDATKLKAKKPARTAIDITVEQVIEVAIKLSKPLKRPLIIKKIAAKYKAGFEKARLAMVEAESLDLFKITLEHRENTKPASLYILDTHAALKWRAEQITETDE